jgi:hypothetical protein
MTLFIFLCSTPIFIALMVLQYKLGEKRGREDERGRVEGILHAAICIRMSPTLRIVWARIRGEYTREEMENKLLRLPTGRSDK